MAFESSFSRGAAGVLAASTEGIQRKDSAQADGQLGGGGFQPSIPGLLLLDASLQPVYLNNEAVKILAYPEAPQVINSLDGFLREKIRAVFTGGESFRGSPLPVELISGRRHYVCRRLPVDSVFTAFLEGIAVAALLERNNSRSFDGNRVATQFHLSQRERETMELLAHGFTNKEIANRMRISPNTVKTFLRLIMVKMNVTTRSGLVARVFEGVAV